MNTNQLMANLQRAIAKIQKKHPTAQLGLNSGADEEALLAWEAQLNVALPEEVKAVYRCCDGQWEDGADIFNGEEWLSLNRMHEEWQAWFDERQHNGQAAHLPEDLAVDDEVQALWWHPLWLPLTSDGAGNHLCIDLAPTQEGKVGQIIRIWHDDTARTLQANSLGEWLEEYVEALDESDCVYSPAHNAIIDAEILYEESEEDLAQLSESDRQTMQEQWESVQTDLKHTFASLFGDNDKAEALLNKFTQARTKETDGVWDSLQSLFEDDEDKPSELDESQNHSITKQ